MNLARLRRSMLLRRSVISIDPPVTLVLEPPVGGIRIEDALRQFPGIIRRNSPDGEADPFPAVLVPQIAALLQLEDQGELIGVTGDQGLLRLPSVELFEGRFDLASEEERLRELPDRLFL